MRLRAILPKLRNSLTSKDKNYSTVRDSKHLHSTGKLLSGLKVNKTETSLKPLSIPTDLKIKKHFSTLTLEPKNIVVMGAGPSGLGTALEFLNETSKNTNKKIKVFLISDRKTFTRSQIFALEESTLDYIKHLINPDTIELMFKEKKIEKKKNKSTGAVYYTIQIKTLEELFFNELQKYHGINLEIIYTARGTTTFSIDISSQRLILSHIPSNPDLDIKFGDLFAADGAQHKVISSIQNSGVFYRSLPYKQIHNKHATIVYKMPKAFADRFDDFLEQGPNQIPKQIELLASGWKLYSRPTFRLFTVGDVLYLGTEYPDDRNTDVESVRIWGDMILRYNLPDDVVNQLKDIHPETTTFKTTLEEANLNYIPLKNGNIFPIGDCLQIPHYHTARGGNSAVKEVVTASHTVLNESGSTSLKVYDNKMNFLLRNNRQKIKTYLNNREKEETIARELAEREGIKIPSMKI